MQLKKLELCGFKSFANRTEFHFDRGISGIIGPNGCGKSNVVDAIKWVLGDMSAKSLRGSEMLDVIFKGGGGKTAMGYAEISLTFTNPDGRLPVEFSEVTVTRRLFRSGESEYLINKAACRRRDIKELFRGTGVGVDAYSLIEQGKIDRLILSSPKDRRAVFEEAAGVSKYKADKVAAESKLERVNQDLLRMGDVLREVNREIRSIRQQASRAERFHQLKTEHAEKRKLLALGNYHGFAGRRDALAAETAAREAERGALAEESARLEAALGEVAAALRAVEERHTDARTKHLNVDTKAEGLDEAIAREGDRLRDLETEHERASGEAGRQGERAAQAAERCGAARREQGDAEAARADAAARLEENEARLKEAQAECVALARDLEAKRAESRSNSARSAGRPARRSSPRTSTPSGRRPPGWRARWTISSATWPPRGKNFIAKRRSSGASGRPWGASTTT